MDSELEETLWGRLSDTFAEGGGFMYPITGLAVLLPLLALVLLLVTAARGRGALTAGLVILGLVASSFGLVEIGEMLGQRNIDAALAAADPIDQEVIRIVGQMELLALRLFASGGAVLPGLLGCVLVGLGLSQLDRFKARP